MSCRILVTDGNERAALATVRSLGRAGFDVEVCSQDGASLAGASRYCSAEHQVPSPLDDPSSFTDRVFDLCATHPIDLLFPITDAALLAILPRAEELERTDVPFPSFSAYSTISDKARLMEMAQDVGIRVPRQIELERPGQSPLDGQTLPPFPLAVKPARSVITVDGTRRQTGVRYATDSDQLNRILERYPPEAYPLLLQERIRGPGIGVFLLLARGELVAAFAHRRLREKPPTGGVSVYREAVPLDPELVQLSRKLLERYNWCGVAMVEFKRSSRNGHAYLMEVNGRFWGSLQLAVDAGVDFPSLLADSALGKPLRQVSEYRIGTRCRWLLGDLDHLLLRLRRRYDPSELPPGSGGRLKLFLTFVGPWLSGARGEVFRLSDPKPGLREWGQWFGRVLT